MAMNEPTTSALSIIDSVQVSNISQTMQKIAQFQSVVQKTLKQGHDYGIVPGTGGKPTLLKPGAEKILMLMGLTSEYELIEKVQDYESGFFAFTVKSTICKGPTKITEGLGHANTREKRYTSGRQQDAYTLANTCLKMAKKRAQVDAVLTVASLSEIFTQDIEDFVEDSETGNGRPQQQTNSRTISEAQRKRLFAIANNSNTPEDAIKWWIKKYYNLDTTSGLTKQPYDETCTATEDGTILQAWQAEQNSDNSDNSWDSLAKEVQ